MSAANPPGPNFASTWTTTGSAPEHVTAHNDIADYINVLSLDGLTDVSTTGVVAGNVLVWSTAVSQFIPGGVTGSGGVTSHSALSGVTANQHHNKVHDHSTAAEGGTVAHSDLTGIGSSDHHAWPPTMGILTDTNMTGAQANILVGTGNADALHSHSAAGTQATSDLSDWSTGQRSGGPTWSLGAITDGAIAVWSSTAVAWLPISTTALSGSTALPTTIVEGVTVNHVDHTEKLHILFNTILGLST